MEISVVLRWSSSVCRACRPTSKIIIPSVLGDLSHSDLLFTKCEAGISLADDEALLSARVDVTRAVNRIVRAFAKSYFVDQFFCACPALADFLVSLESGEMEHWPILVDCGRTRAVGVQTAVGMAMILVALKDMDEQQFSKGFQIMGCSVKQGEATDLVRRMFHRNVEPQQDTATTVGDGPNDAQGSTDKGTEPRLSFLPQDFAALLESINCLQDLASATSCKVSEWS